MQYKMPLAAACLALGTMSLPAVSSAAALPGASQSTQELGQRSSITESVQWRRGWGRCRAWRRECSARWGWGGPRFYVGSFDGGCYVRRLVATPWGLRWRTVNRCY